MEIAGKKCEVLYREGSIEDQVEELSIEIDDTYESVSEPILLVGVLKGAIPFLGDLMRCLKHPCMVEYIQVRSYEGIAKSENHTVNFRPTLSPTNKHIVIVEDIVDTGHTALKIQSALNSFSPASIAMCTLLDKSGARQVDVPFLNFIGFKIPEKFVVGYGLDYNEQYRELRDIWALVD